MHSLHGASMARAPYVALLVMVLFIAAVPSETARAAPSVPTSPSMTPLSPPIPPAPPLMRPPRAGATRGTPPESLSGIITDPIVAMKVLVLYKSGNADGVFQSIKAYLDILGVPYDAVDTGLLAPNGTIEESDLWDGVNHGYYYAVMISTSDVWFTYLDAAERTLVEAYERAFAVRQVTLYAYPEPTEYGLTYVGVAPLPMNGSLTSAGQVAFSYLKPTISISFHLYDVYGYLAQPAVAHDVTSLLQDPTGNTMLAIFRPGDGREHMVFTMSSYYPVIPPSNIHARLLPYGMIDWATRGAFLGERHVYFSPQPDDFLAWGDCWNPVTHSYIWDTCYRNQPNDLDNLALWQAAFQLTVPNAAGLRIEMPFNAQESFEGDPPEVDDGQVVPNTLTAKAVELQDQFTWLNHTYSHEDLDNKDYSVCYDEIQKNNDSVSVLQFADYSTATLLTGAYSGLTNPNLAQAAYDLGVRYLEVDSSQWGYSNPTPNTGIPHPSQPAILQVPRYPTNIFYAISNPEQQTDLYNWIYCPGYPGVLACYDYDAILESVTNQSLATMLDFSVDATMFHMNNLDAYNNVYDGTGHTIMGDFVEALYGQYNSYFGANVPVLSLRTQEIGQKMRDRMAFNASGVTGERACGNEITLRTVSAARIPVTGVSFGSNVESYAGQTISTIDMGDNTIVVIPGAPVATPAAIDDLSALRSSNDVVLTWSPTTHDTQGQPLGALAYRVYGKAGDPEFAPTPVDLLAEVSSPTYTHLGAAGSSETYTYVVTAVGDNCWKRESTVSNRLASFAWTVSPGYNLLSVPLLMPATGIQAVLGTQLTGGHSLDTADRVFRFNPTTQSYDQVAAFGDGTGDPAFDGKWYDAFDFGSSLSSMTLDLHDGFWVHHHGTDVRKVVIFGRVAMATERLLPITAGPYQIIGSGYLTPMPVDDSHLWESGASGGVSIDTGDQLLSFDAGTQSYDTIAVLLVDGTWADGQSFPDPSPLTLVAGKGYWFFNQTPANTFSWTYP